MYFANEIMQQLLVKSCKLAQEQISKNNFASMQRCIHKKFIFQYQSKYGPNKNHLTRKQSRHSHKKSKNSSQSESNTFSLVDILKLSQTQLNEMVFMFNPLEADLLDDQDDFTEIQELLKHCNLFKGTATDLIPRYMFFQVKKSHTVSFDKKNRYTIQLLDLSSKMFSTDIGAQKEFMNTTTSSISHEMRNPLNSIILQCKIQEQNIRALARIID